MQKITPFLWYDKEAKEAAEFYVSVFGEDSKVTDVQTIDGTPSGTIEIVTVTLRGLTFNLMSAGPYFKFSEATSFVIGCDSQEEVDHFWNNLSAVPEAEQCGWLKDKYGVSWQVVPTILDTWTSDPDKEKAGRTLKAMLEMKKLDIAALKAAYDGN